MKKIFNEKILIYIMILLVFASFAYADKVTIFNFNYNQGKISLKGQFIKEGFYPDRNINLEKSYECKLLDKDNNNLYSFRFRLPIKLYTDIIENKEISGDVIILNQTDFSMISPYLTKASDIACFNPQGYEIIKEKIEKINLSSYKINIWLWIYSGLAFIGLLFIVFKNKRKNSSI